MSIDKLKQDLHKCKTLSVLDDLALEIFNNVLDEAEREHDKINRAVNCICDIEKFLDSGNPHLAKQAIIQWRGLEPPQPLTLDELRQMDGAPVYIVLLDTKKQFWDIRPTWISLFNYGEPVVRFPEKWYYHKDYGKTWVAYRYKPKEDKQCF